MDTEAKLADLIDDRDFQQVAARVARFNLFEAIGAVRGELRHSNFLSFLFSPARSHGLGSKVLLRTLRAILAKMPAHQRPIRALELVVGDLDGAIVYRERDNIDILVEIDALKLVVVIENKIDAEAGAGQLRRYREIIEARYPARRHLFVFMTPKGTKPDEPRYVAFSYKSFRKSLWSLSKRAPRAIRASFCGTTLKC